MPHQEILLHHRPAQIQVAVFQPEILGNIDGILNRERRSFGLVQDGQFRSHYIDLSRREIGILGSFRAEFHFARDGDDKFRPKSLGRLMGLPGMLRCEHNLGLAVTIPQVDKHNASQITANVDPSCQGDGLADMLSPEFSARVRTLLVAVHGSTFMVKRFLCSWMPVCDACKKQQCEKPHDIRPSRIVPYP